LYSNTVVSADFSHSGNFSLHLIGEGQGSTLSFANQVLPLLNATNTYTLSFWFLPSRNGAGLTARVTLGYRTITPIDYRPQLTSPGAPNGMAATSPVFPDVWINEILPNNVTGLADNFGDRDSWVELYNAGLTPVSLNGWFLTDTYSNLTRWAFPAGASIGPRQFLLAWLDGEPQESTPSALHTSFRASTTNGSIGLVFPGNGLPTLLDYVNYNLTAADRSIGYYPDGQSGSRESFSFPSPGATNSNRVAPVQLYINEWMAANTAFLADPADGDFDDWLEIYNPNDMMVDLSGYSLSDRINDPGARWTIPIGRSIPARGFQLVWADEETSQNTFGGDLHAGFRLSQSGEALALFAPDGTLLDSVTFLMQTNNVSQGRWPDGIASVFYMSNPTPRAPNQLGGGPPPVVIFGVARGPSAEFILTWTSVAGTSYVLESKTNLNLPAWTSLQTVVATGPQTSSTNVLDGSAQKFYRLREVR